MFLVAILILPSATYNIYMLINKELIVGESSILFKYAINGIYGINPIFENGLWSFDFLPLNNTINPLQTYSKSYTGGFMVIITLRETRCICSTHYWFWANATVINFNCTIYSNGSEVFFVEGQDNILEFDFGIFSTDMQIILYVDTIPRKELVGCGEIKKWQ